MSRVRFILVGLLVLVIGVPCHAVGFLAGIAASGLSRGFSDAHDALVRGLSRDTQR